MGLPQAFVSKWGSVIECASWQSPLIGLFVPACVFLALLWSPSALRQAHWT